MSILTHPVSSRAAADPVLPLRDAAALAGCHPDTLKNQAKRGKLTLLRISQRRLGIRQSEFERYLNAGAISYEPRG
jgi:hypothetical protein